MIRTLVIEPSSIGAQYIHPLWNSAEGVLVQINTHILSQKVAAHVCRPRCFAACSSQCDRPTYCGTDEAMKLADVLIFGLSAVAGLHATNGEDAVSCEAHAQACREDSR